jgi:radical SAM superfamily enzyme YgiQ (UPF0313 family)
MAKGSGIEILRQPCTMTSMHLSGTMRALLINPFIYDFAAYDFWAKPRGLLEVGGLLCQLGFEVELIDCLYPQDAGMAVFARERQTIELPQTKAFGAGSYFHEEIPKPEGLRTVPRRFYRYGFHPDYLRQRLFAVADEPAVIGLTGIMTYWGQGVRDTIRVVREVFPHSPVVLGGIYPTLLPGHAREHSGADHLFPGRATANSLKAFLEQIGVPMPVRNPRSAQVKSPADTGLYYPYTRPSYGVTALSEGCHFRCTYCACGLLYSGWTARNTQHALAEVQFAASRGARDFAFYDDDLLWDAENLLLPFLEQATRTSGGLRWHAANGLALRKITLPLAQALRHYGFQTLRFGFETADENLSQRLGHKLGCHEFKRKIDWLFQAGFAQDQIGVYLMMGLPGQSPQQVEDSIRFVRDCGVPPHLAEFSPVPGTPEFERARTDALVDFAREPMLQNNSLLPLRSRSFNWDVVNHLKNLASKA